MLLVRLANVYKSFKNKRVLDSVDFEVNMGEKVCIVGPNGAGKTTLLRVILGTVRPDRGEVYVFSRDASKIGYVPQIPTTTPHHRAFDFVYYSLRIAGIPKGEAVKRASEWLELLGINSKTTGSGLSGGERKLVNLAMALAKNPELLILDEPTNMLDVSRRRLVRGLIEGFKGSVILVTHDLDEVRLADTICFMSRGRIVFRGGFRDFAKLVRTEGYVLELRSGKEAVRREIRSIEEISLAIRDLGEVDELRISRITPEDIEELIRGGGNRGSGNH